MAEKKTIPKRIFNLIIMIIAFAICVIPAAIYVLAMLVYESLADQSSEDAPAFKWIDKHIVEGIGDILENLQK